MILKIYEKSGNTDKPFIVFCGATWVWEREKEKITVWYEGVAFEYPCKAIGENQAGTIAYAYGSR